MEAFFSLIKRQYVLSISIEGGILCEISDSEVVIMKKLRFNIQRFAGVVHGNSSQNKLTNNNDNTQIYGLAGNDTIESNGKKNFIIIGGSGNDVLSITGGNGTLNGGAGNDSFYLNYSALNTLSVVIEDIEPTNDKILINYSGTGTPKINYSTVDKDIVLTDDEGYLNVTLKGYREANDYFDGDAHENIWEVFKIVNQERENQGLNQLTLSQGLIDATSIRATELTQLYSHTRPNGTDCYTAIKKFYNPMGENIAAGQNSPSEVMNNWMNSTGHRANILNADFKKIGVGYYYKSGTYYGNHWVQMFGGELIEYETLTTKELLDTKINLSVNDVTLTDSTLEDIATIKRTSITGTEVSDLIVNGRWYGEIGETNVIISGGNGNDTITSSGSNSVLDGGSGTDLIYNGYYYYDNGWEGFLENSCNNEYNDEDGTSKVTIIGGTGNDIIHNKGKETIYKYTLGDGSDTIYGFNDNDTLQIINAAYTTVTSGDNLIVNVGDDSIFLENAANISVNIAGTPLITLNTGSAAVNNVSTDGSGNVIISTSEGIQTLEGAASQNVQFSNDYIQSSPISVQFSDKPSINDEAKFYWATTTDAEVSFADYTQSNAEIKLNNSNFNDTNNIAFYGDIKTLNATGYTGHAVLNGKDGKDNIIFGGEGTSVLWGGYNSDDVLVGGNGSDLFWYIQGSGNDWIRNSSSNDKILMEGITLDELVGGGGQIIGNDVVVELKNGNSLTVENAKTSGVVFDFSGTKYAVNQSTGEWEFR